MARLQRRRGGRRFVDPLAHVLDEIARRRFRQPVDDQRIEPARAFDADRVPEEAAGVRHLGDVRHRQMLVGAPPRRQPELDDVGRDADMVGDHPGGKQEPGELEVSSAHIRLECTWMRSSTVKA